MSISSEDTQPKMSYSGPHTRPCMRSGVADITAGNDDAHDGIGSVICRFGCFQRFIETARSSCLRFIILVEDLSESRGDIFKAVDQIFARGAVIGGNIKIDVDDSGLRNQFLDILIILGETLTDNHQFRIDGGDDFQIGFGWLPTFCTDSSSHRRSRPP